MSPGSIVIPAHDEEAVIGRTLAPLVPLIEQGVEVLVAPNGCTDATAERARAVPGVRVVDVPQASKVAALNTADALATGWPRLYLDADITITPAAVAAVFARLDQPGVLAARPAFAYDTSGADPGVRAYYRARGRIPAMHEHLWGAGAYALNEAGHARLGRFPELTADDLYVDQLFSREEVAIVDTTPVQVRVPRTSRALLHTLVRVQRGKTEVQQTQHVDPAGGLRPLLQGVSGPSSVADAAAYAGFAVAARFLARSRGGAAWQRDDTNRVVDGPAVSP